HPTRKWSSIPAGIAGQQRKNNHYAKFIHCQTLAEPAVSIGLGCLHCADSDNLGDAGRRRGRSRVGQTDAPIPFAEIAAKAGAQYQGDGLSVLPSPEGARLRCVFQKLKGRRRRRGYGSPQPWTVRKATASGSWLRPWGGR